MDRLLVESIYQILLLVDNLVESKAHQLADEVYVFEGQKTFQARFGGQETDAS